MKYAYNDIAIMPCVVSEISSRSECCSRYDDGMLPVFTAPMTSVVSDKNMELFKDNGIIPIAPRSVSHQRRLELLKNGDWVAFSMKEAYELFSKDNPFLSTLKNSTVKVCVDVANGHMKELYDTCIVMNDVAEMNGINLIIMTGNIGNPETIKYIINEVNYNSKVISYIRVGIGSGMGCITSSNTAVHYPMASLIQECVKVRKACKSKNKPQIIADGGIRNYSDITRAIALGADYVMIGGILSQTVESNAPKSSFKDGLISKFDKSIYESTWKDKNGIWHGKRKDSSEVTENIGKLTSIFYGMASRQGQEELYGEKKKTAEGIMKTLPVLYTVKDWVNNLDDYLKSAMSYTGNKTLYTFKTKTKTIILSSNAQTSINK